MVERLRRCNPQVVRREFRWWRRQKRNHDFASALGCAMCLSSPFHQVWSGLAEPGYKSLLLPSRFRCTMKAMEVTYDFASSCSDCKRLADTGPA